MKHLLDAIDQALIHSNWYAALSVALTIPDICGCLEDPGAKTGARYKKWFNKYLLAHYTRKVGPLETEHVFLSADDCYALRCAFLHEGSDDITAQAAQKVLERFVFVKPLAGISHLNQYQKQLVLQVDRFCLEIIEAGEKWLAAKGSEPEIAKRLSQMARIKEPKSASMFPI